MCALALTAIFFAHALDISRVEALDRLENRIYDWRLVATMPKTLDSRVVILDIDEKSLAELGRWPWGRDKLAQLMNKVFDEQKMAIVGFDVVFAERDVSSGLPELERLARGPLRDNRAFRDQVERLRPSLDYDAQFVEAVKGRPVVLGYFLTADRSGRKGGKLPTPVFGAEAFPPGSEGFRRFDGYGANLPELQDAALSAGSFNVTPDLDGTVRRMPLILEHAGNYYETLSLAIVRALHGGRKPAVGFGGGVATNDLGFVETIDIVVGERIQRIPVDANGATLIPFRGSGNVDGGSYRYVSIADILAGRIPPGELRDKIGIVGTTAVGLFDLRTTPVGEVYPGVETHANMISGMLDNQIKERPPYTLGAEVLQLLLVGLVLGLILPFLSVLRMLAFSLIAVVAVIAINLFFYLSVNLVFPLASALALMASVILVNITYGYFVESASKRELAGLFGSYLPPELVDEMAKDPSSYTMEGRSEELTVMFSDVRGFTSISETLNPKELSEYINEYLTAMSLIIQTHRGTLDKYIGDAIMAFWGAPVAEPRHAQKAVETALEMQEGVKQLSEKFRERNWPELRIGIGLSTGQMSVGDMGSQIRRAYTVMGDAVNLGSRLEGITKVYGVGILVAEATHNAVSGIVFREIDRVRVKGKDEPIAIFEPIGLEGQVDAATLSELQLWEVTLKAFRAQQWDQCEMQLINLNQAHPRGLYQEYLDRVAALRLHPPGADWDGVTTFTTK